MQFTLDSCGNSCILAKVLVFVDWLMWQVTLITSLLNLKSQTQDLHPSWKVSNSHSTHAHSSLFLTWSWLPWAYRFTIMTSMTSMMTCWALTTRHATSLSWSSSSIMLSPAARCYDKDLQTDFYLFNSVYWYWSHNDSHFIFLPASGPICSCWLMRSSLLWLRAAPYCTLLHTVTYCCSDAIVLVMPIVRITLLFSYST